MIDSEGEDLDDSSEHQQQSPPGPKKLARAATYRPSSTPFGYLTIEFFLKLRGLYVVSDDMENQPRNQPNYIRRIVLCIAYMFPEVSIQPRTAYLVNGTYEVIECS